MKKINLTAIFGTAILLLSCSTEVTSEGEVGTEEEKVQKIEEFVAPVAKYLSATKGVQLTSFFDANSYNGGEVTLEATARTAGSSGSDGAIFLTEFTVDDVLFEPFVLVSDEDKTKTADALDKKEKAGEEKRAQVIFTAKLVKEGSYESPFGHQMKLKFADGKLISVD